MSEALLSNLNEKIKESGLSLNELEKMAGLKGSAVKNIVYGRSKNPTVNTVQKIANCLGVSLNELIGNKEKPIIASTKPVDHKLYLACTNAVLSHVKSSGYHCNLEILTSCIKEVYRYLTKKNLSSVDPDVVEWVLENKLL